MSEVQTMTELKVIFTVAIGVFHETVERTLAGDKPTSMPRGAYRYQIMEKVTKTATIDGEKFVKNAWRPIGGYVYPGGEIVTSDDPRIGSIGRDNLRINKMTGVLTCVGTLAFFEPGDTIAPPLPTEEHNDHHG